jgi:hypothetical protein
MRVQGSILEVFMNYIELINNFWKVFRQNDFGSLEAALYLYLLDFANSLNWSESFRLPNSSIAETLKCSACKLHRARKNLVNSGLIKYSPGSRSTPGSYVIESATYSLPIRERSAINRESIVKQFNTAPDQGYDAVENGSRESIRDQSATNTLSICEQSANRSLNKTKINKTKEDQDILSPYGETKTEFSDFTKGEGNITAGEEKGQRQDVPDTVFQTQASSSNREAGPEQGLIFSPLDTSGDAVPIVGSPPLADLPSGSRQSGNETARACSKYELDVIQTWETLIGPFDDSWIASLREVLEKCYPSQVKSAILVMAKSRLEVMKETGFTYIAQPLIGGMFGKRGKKNGRNDRAGSGEFESDIEKFKNPARAKPKTREELLKYTMY